MLFLSSVDQTIGIAGSLLTTTTTFSEPTRLLWGRLHHHFHCQAYHASTADNDVTVFAADTAATAAAAIAASRPRWCLSSTFLDTPKTVIT